MASPWPHGLSPDVVPSSLAQESLLDSDVAVEFLVAAHGHTPLGRLRRQLLQHGKDLGDLLDGSLCQRAQRLVDIIIVSMMVLKQQAPEGRTNLTMGLTDLCEIVLSLSSSSMRSISVWLSRQQETRLSYRD
jgi:hypothetical protein